MEYKGALLVCLVNIHARREKNLNARPILTEKTVFLGTSPAPMLVKPS